MKDIGATKKTNVCLEAYGGLQINAMGAATLNCNVMKNKHRFNHKLKFIVIDGPSAAVRPILGLEAFVNLGLVKKLDSIDKSSFICF